jgi:hypothetical protein
MFSGILAHQLIQMANKLEADHTNSKFLLESEPIYMVSLPQNLSSPTLFSSLPITSGKNVIQSATDCVTRGESYSLSNKCDERDCFNEHVKKLREILDRAKKWELT